MTRRGLGAVPNRLADVELDAAERHVGLLLGDKPSFAPMRDWTSKLDAVLDQGQTNACVGHAESSALYLRGQTQGEPIPRPARRWIYSVAQWVDTPGVVVDQGCRPRSAMTGMQHHGVVAEASFPWDESQVLAPPPFDLDVAGADSLLVDFFWVDGADPDLLRAASDVGEIPTITIAVHEAFEELKAGQVYDEPGGKFLGNHRVAVVGYAPGKFKILNSWGPRWCEEGCFWVSDRFITSAYVTDRYVIRSVPKNVTLPPPSMTRPR